VIITGIGKSGLIGHKIAATLTSTGTRSLFLHPVEGIHGDLGIVTKEDILLAISNSGETRELMPVIGSVRHTGAPVIAFTGKMSSSLAKISDIVIDVSVEKEACPFGLAPTSSSTATLAMGDALAIALIDRRNFLEKDFYGGKHFVLFFLGQLEMFFHDSLRFDFTIKSIIDQNAAGEQ
jgi:arabinose-5-phosphate isomerase